MQKVIFERNPEMTDEELEFVVGGLSDGEIVAGGVGACIGASAVIGTLAITFTAVVAAA